MGAGRRRRKEREGEASRPRPTIDPGVLVRQGGWVLAAVVALLILSIRARGYDPLVSRYTRYFVHGFDGYPYLAMADEPYVFTITHWGYRLLAPWIVHVVSPADPIAGFRGLTFVSLVAIAALLTSSARCRTNESGGCDGSFVRAGDNGRAVEESARRAEPRPRRFDVPATALFRGDNEVRLLTSAPGEVRLRAFSVRRSGGS